MKPSMVLVKSSLFSISFFCFSAANAEKQAVRKSPLVIEGKKDQSPIENLEPMSLPDVEEAPMAVVKPRVEEPSVILDDPDALLGLGDTGLPIRTREN